MSKELHGLSTTPEYLAWKAMKWRCNPKNKANRRQYFERGIFVCLEWANSFLAFLAHIGKMPSPGLEVDRKDGSAGYEPGNVRWATQKEQMLNTRANHQLTINGKTQPLAQWAESAGISPNTLTFRVARNWPESELLSTEKGRHRVPRPVRCSCGECHLCRNRAAVARYARREALV